MLPGRLETHLSADAAPSAAWMLGLGRGRDGKRREREEPKLQPEFVSSHWRGGVKGGTGRGGAANFRQILHEHPHQEPIESSMQKC